MDLVFEIFALSMVFLVCYCHKEIVKSFEGIFYQFLVSYKKNIGGGERVPPPLLNGNKVNRIKINGKFKLTLRTYHKT